jgi:uncharacterized RDD family membrane protein YckC
VAKLILNPTSSSRREIPLARTLLSIGRDPSNDLVLPDALVSRRHAVVECRGAQYVIRDCNSSNGSLVNGDRVTEHPLKDGDLLAIGTARILFREVEAEDASAKVVPHPSSPKLQCPSCQADYRRGDAFCRKCGHALPPPPPASVDCPSCGKSVPLPANYCNACGAPVPREDGLDATRPRARSNENAAPPASAESRPASAEGPSVPGSAPVPAPVPPPEPVVAVPPLPQPPESAAVSPPVAEMASAPAMAASSGAAKMVIPSSAPRPTPMPRPRPAEVARPISRPSIPPLRRTSTQEPTPAAWVDTTPAGFGVRLMAGLIDFGLVGFVQALLLAPVVFHFQRLFDQPLNAPAVEPGFVAVLLSVAVVFVAMALGAGYFVYGWGVKGATLGKSVMGLVVQGENGDMPIGIGRALLRLLGYMLSGALLGFGFLMIAFGGDGLHDRLASTRVVRRPRP